MSAISAIEYRKYKGYGSNAEFQTILEKGNSKPQEGRSRVLFRRGGLFQCDSVKQYAGYKWFRRLQPG